MGRLYLLTSNAANDSLASCGSPISKQVAAKRQKVLSAFLRAVLAMPSTVSCSDLVYAFFHSTPRDLHDAMTTREVRLRQKGAEGRKVALVFSSFLFSLGRLKRFLPSLVFFFSDFYTGGWRRFAVSRERDHITLLIPRFCAISLVNCNVA